jgi:hypothetical protein
MPYHQQLTQLKMRLLEYLLGGEARPSAQFSTRTVNRVLDHPV